jgi:hypothetical protein
MRIPTYVAAAVVAGLAMTGCGTDDPAAGTSDRQQQARDAQLAFAKCMREHGVDMPDPEPGERGLELRVPEGVSPDEVNQAQEACDHHLESIEPPELSEEELQERKEAALAHARCMRENGVENFPDPTFQGGGAQLKIGPESGIDPNSLQFRDAQEACEDKLPELRRDEQ